ncbi:23S rRNA (pseudouridine(1915)-N(3))-methyltransferase RlmH [Paenibacillus sp. HJGM_3]|uniref:23S rRNA (pseudouridine(1915)-N(3))-methyltransferase RlmH n=1 Tax=Paenibacillus sp. HJGM_3 TaxID=3379816 RepID=UPI00385BD732
MLIQIVAVGKLKEKYLMDGIAEYVKRMTPYAKLQIVEVAEEKAPERLSAAEEALVKQREGERLLAAIKSDDTHVIALAIEGEPWSSEELARHIAGLGTYGTSQLAFVIGGSLGLSEAVLQRAARRLSFGRITLPHQLMRLVLAEQVYRAYKIMRGEPYHK